MIPLNYHQLYYFWTIAKAGSLKKGSERLLLSASTLSTQLTQLEKTMKVKMLDRGRDGVSLTTEGRVIFERCERIFSEGEALAYMVRKDKMPMSTFLRLGVQNSVSAWITLEAISFIETLRKNIRVSVFGGSHQDLQERLHRHSLDIIITNSDYSTGMGRDFESRLFGKIPLTFVATRAFRKKICEFPADLNSFPIIMPPEGTSMRKSIDVYLHRNKISPDIVAEVENPMLIRQLAREGFGAAVVDLMTVARDIKEGTLVKLHRKPVGLDEHVWSIYYSGALANNNLAAAIHAITRKFALRANMTL